MVYKVIFNEKSFKYDKEDVEYNYYVVKHELEYLRDLLYRRGYLYMNQVFEFLGLVWNTKNTNELMLNGYYVKSERPFTYKKANDKNAIEIEIFIP